jgi:hypothetical protein
LLLELVLESLELVLLLLELVLQQELVLRLRLIPQLLHHKMCHLL